MKIVLFYYESLIFYLRDQTEIVPLIQERNAKISSRAIEEENWLPDTSKLYY